eukprot:scaffold105678_cov32-Tisochrysis_lutea.AAC.3
MNESSFERRPSPCRLFHLGGRRAISPRMLWTSKALGSSCKHHLSICAKCFPDESDRCYSQRLENAITLRLRTRLFTAFGSSSSIFLWDAATHSYKSTMTRPSSRSSLCPTMSGNGRIRGWSGTRTP